MCHDAPPRLNLTNNVEFVFYNLPGVDSRHLLLRKGDTFTIIIPIGMLGILLSLTYI